MSSENAANNDKRQFSVLYQIEYRNRRWGDDGSLGSESPGGPGTEPRKLNKLAFAYPTINFLVRQTKLALVFQRTVK